MSPPPTGFSFGQTERLTRRLSGLIRSYPRGLGVLKEFIQNADDAGATELRVVLDMRTHASTRLPDSHMVALMGPALLLYNDARFTDDDLTAIRRIGESSKEDSGPKTGRFGLGFNTAYNVTDYPCFASNDGIYCFDPHQDAAAVEPDHGRGWRLSNLWRDFPDWPAAFEAGGLARGQVDLAGTIFRLPLRTPERAAKSDISKEPFGEGDVLEIVRQAAELGSALLLFTRNLERLSVERVDSTGRSLLLRIDAVDQDRLQAMRQPLRDALRGSWHELLARWRRSDEALPFTSGEQRWNVWTPEGERVERWHAMLALARGEQGRLLEAAAQMLDLGEKAIPWVGVAARLEGASVAPVAGRLYCGLPLPLDSEQPIHINGYFDLDSSRQRLTAGADAAGATMRARVAWNEALLDDGVAWLWSRLLVELARADVQGLYSIFPSGARLERTAVRVYALLSDRPVLRTCDAQGVRFTRPKGLSLPPPEWRKALRAPLMAEGYPMPEPELPTHVEQGFAGVIGEITPAVMRERFRQKKVLKDRKWVWEDIDRALSEAPHAALRQKAWVESLLRFVRSDGSTELGGLPLLILTDGRLHTIGPWLYYLATSDQRALFPTRRNWFVDPEFLRATGLVSIPDVSLRTMLVSDVVGQLHHDLGKERVRAWSPDAPGAPNAAWLLRLATYLGAHELSEQDAQALLELPLLPGSDGRLHRPGHALSPLLVPSDESSGGLLAALRGLEITVVDAAPPIMAALRALVAKVRELARPLTGPNLVEALHERRDRTEAIEAGATALLDFLAEARWSYSGAALEKLRAVPLLPTLAGGRVAANDGKVFLASAFKPPALALPVHLLGDAKRWGALYEKLGVREVDGPRYLVKVLLPELPSLVPDVRHAAAEWLRDHLQGLLAQLGEAAAEARRKLAAIPLVWGPEERLWCASDLYDPESELIQEVLGEAVPRPDMRRYRSRREHWLAFFRAIGLVVELSPALLLAHIERLMGQGATSAKALERVFDHLEKNWKDLSKAKLRLGGLELNLAQALGTRAWMPAKQSSKRPGFKAPEARLYRPSELAQDEDLVGSQLPVSAWTVTAGMAGDLGMIRQPPAAAVLRHLQHLIALWTAAPGSADRAKTFDPAFRAIYRHLDRYCDPRPGPDAPTFNRAEDQLLEDLRDEACIWDARTGRLWRPEHVYVEPVPFFEPLRTQVSLGLGDRFLARLGRQQAPETEDFESFLGALHEHSGDTRLTADQRKQAIYALQQIARGPSDEPLPLVSRDDRLQISDRLFWDDAPWLSDRLGALDVAAADVPVAVLDALGVRRVSRHVKEQLVQVARRPVESTAIQVCEALERRVQAPEFAAGLLRLLRHDHDAPELAVDLSLLRRLRVAPASLIVVKVVLDEEHSLGESDSKQYFDAAAQKLYLVGRSEPRLAKWVVQVIVRLLGKHAPKSEGAVEHILQCEPSEVEEVLNEDRITAVKVDASSYDWGSGDSYVEPDREELWDDAEALEEDAPAAPGEADQNSEQTQSAPPRPPPMASPGTNRSAAATAGTTKASNSAQVAEPTEPTVATGGAPVVRPGAGPAGSPLPRVPGSGPSRPGLSPQLEEHLGDDPPVADAQALRPSDQLWADAAADRPPSPSSTGQPRARRDAVGGEVLRLEADSGPSEEVSREVGERAMAEAMSFELAHGRSPKRMPDGNPGYDIESTDAEGSVRLIEVKGLARDWRNHPAMLTQTQLMYAIQHRSNYWVYVVERTSGTPRLHPIRDPAAHVTRFALGASWARFAETAPPPEAPREGLILSEGETTLGPILRVRSAGALHHVWIASVDGEERRIVFQPGLHTLKEPSDGNGPP